MYSLSEGEKRGTSFHIKLNRKKIKNRKNSKATRGKNGTAKKNVCVYVRGELVGVRVP